MKSFSPWPLLDRMISLEQSGNLAQALLISAELDSGALIRERLVRALLCEQDRAAACECRSCQAPLDSHPDYIELVPAPRSIGRDAVRQAVDILSAGPLWSRTKVIACVPADALGDAAESFLLKHLEEPPPYARYVLMVENADTMIATIRSRCQLWRFARDARVELIEDDMLAQLKKESLTVDRVVRAAYWVRERYRVTGLTSWLQVWEVLAEACRQIEANGNEDLVRARVLRAWPLGS